MLKSSGRIAEVRRQSGHNFSGKMWGEKNEETEGDETTTTTTTHLFPLLISGGTEERQRGNKDELVVYDKVQDIYLLEWKEAEGCVVSNGQRSELLSDSGGFVADCPRFGL